METELLVNPSIRTARGPAADLTGQATGQPRAIPLIHGARKSLVHLQLKATLLAVLFSCYRNPVDWIRGLGYLVRLRRTVLGNHRVRKMVRVGGRYYMGLYTPGWDDATYRKFIASELAHFKAHTRATYRFNQVFLAITKKCPLQCEHCSAWDTLNERDTLDLKQFGRIFSEINRLGTAQLYFTGGEPMVKFNRLEELVSSLPPELKSWVSTSGFQLTREKARRLRSAGLTGVFVSLDHYLPEVHNAFRGHPEAFTWAVKGARNALDENLVVAFSVCLSDELCRNDALKCYMDFARQVGVHFVQFFEPKAVGHYRDKDVRLSPASIRMAEQTFLEMNFGREHLDYPIISYHGYYRRRTGCFGAGKRTIYVDADGCLNACPFCQKSYGNLLEGALESNLEAMVSGGCPKP